MSMLLPAQEEHLTLQAGSGTLSVHQGTRAFEIDRGSPDALHVIHLKVAGMECGSCSSKLQQALLSMRWPKVSEIDVDLLAGSVHAHLSQTLSSTKLREAAAAIQRCIELVGLQASILQISSSDVASSKRTGQILEFEVLGMTCGSCAAAVHKAIRRAIGEAGSEIQVNLLAETAVLRFSEDMSPAHLDAAAAAVCAEIEGVGFEASLKPIGDRQDRHENWQQYEAVLAAVVTGGTSSSAEDLEAGTHPEEQAMAALRRHECVLSIASEVSQISEGSVQFRIVFEVKDCERERVLRKLIWYLVDAGLSDVRILETDQDMQSPLQRAQARRIEEAVAWRKLFFCSLFFTVPVVLVMWVLSPVLQTALSPCGIDIAGILMLVLATPVQFGCGLIFYRESFNGLRHGKLGMAAMIVLGTTAAYIASCAQLVTTLIARIPATMSLNFDTSSLLITFVTLGKWLECRAKGETGNAITALIALQPCTTMLLDTDGNGLDGKEREVDTKLLLQGDMVRVLPGAKIPADGLVTVGESTVDESAFSGEFLPVFKGPGHKVIGGTTNHGGTLQVQLHAVGRNSALAQVVRLVEQAQSERAPVQEVADRVSSYFVPVVLGISLLTLCFWLTMLYLGIIDLHGRQNKFSFALLTTISVLVVACPCALGLAAPTAVMVGTGVGALHGILIKGGRALEAAHNIDAVILDKTGTITEGRPRVTDLELLHNWLSEPTLLADVRSHLAELGCEAGCADTSAGEAHMPVMTALLPLVFLAGSAEKCSEHPLGRALVQEAERLVEKCRHHHPNYGKACAAASARNELLLLAEPESFKASPGCGVEATVMGHCVHIGSMAWVMSSGVDVSSGNGLAAVARADRVRAHLEDDGKSVVFVAVDGELRLLVALADTVKQDAAQTVRALRCMGREVYLLTGDSARTAAAVAQRVAILKEHVFAGVLPAGKAQKVRELQGMAMQVHRPEVPANTCLPRNYVSSIFRRWLGRQDRHEVLLSPQSQPYAMRRPHCVAMVGDGVNDAPALAQADLGIAIGAGAEVAIDAADVVLVRSRVSDVVTALHLSSRIFQRIQLNFVFSIGYNSIAIPFAAGLFFALTGRPLAPFISGAAMALSSVSVVTSSLMLRRYHPPSITTLEGRANSRCSKLMQLLRIGRPARSLLEELDSERLLAASTFAVVVHGLLETCSAAWGADCDCHGHLGSCPCRGCPLHGQAATRDIPPSSTPTSPLASSSSDVL